MAKLIMLIVMCLALLTCIVIQPSHTNDQIYSLLNVDNPTFSKRELNEEAITGIIGFIFIFTLLFS